jgi:steroid delta-isomerase-like uncharacterized protein
MEVGRRLARKRRRPRFLRPLLAALGLGLVIAGAGFRRLRAKDPKRRNTLLERNKEIARRALIDIFNEGRFEVVDELVSEGYVGHDTAMPEPIIGPEGLKQSAIGYRSAFPDMTMTVDEQIAEGDSVVTCWTARGTHEGELFGMPPTGRQATVTGITINRIIDGKLAEARTNWDTLGMLQQLGAVPAMAQA